MKAMRKVGAVLLAMLAMVCFAVPAFGETITINNSSQNVSMDGQIYNAYKVFDVTYSGDAYAYTLDEDFENFTYTPSGQSELSGQALVTYVSGLTSDSDEMNAFAEAVRSYITTNTIKADGSATGTTTNSVTIDVTSAGAGYYIVLGSAAADTQEGEIVVAFAALSTTNPDATVDVKADIPTVEKEVNADSEGNGTWGPYADYEVGDTVPFRITGTIPSYAEGYDEYTYVIHDSLSVGLTLDTTSIKVYTDANLTQELDSNNYSIATSELGDGCSFHVTINPDYIKGNHEDTIYVGYTATVNDDVVIYTDENTNDTYIEFSNNPYDADSKDKTPDKQVKVYSYSFDLFKFYMDNEQQVALAGAGFRLYGDEAGNTEIPVVLVSAGNDTTASVYRVATTEEIEKSSAVEMITPASGLITIQGLDAGTYYLRETTTPDGYHALDGAIAVVIAPTANETQTDVASLTVSGSGSNVTMNGNTVQVENLTGSLLPTTGGMGTTVFYIVGAVLVVGAGVGVVVKRRMNGQ